MNFQGLVKVEKADFYLDIAFKRASKVAEQLRSKKYKTRLVKRREIEKARIKAVAGSVEKHLKKIVVCFPDIEALPKFYYELVKCTLDYPMLKKSLAAISWAHKQVSRLCAEYEKKISSAPDTSQIIRLRREFYGRVASVIKQVKNNFEIIESSRRTMRSYPTVKTGLATVVITGFPNIGKTTLLYKLTGSKPEINSYAFTTKSINVGYLKEEKQRVQILDTPGTLNRFNKMNVIEKQAFLALKHLAKAVVYVFDLTEPYPIKEQIRLYEHLKKEGKPMLCYLSKTDILEESKIGNFIKRYNCTTSVEELKKRILSLFK